MLSNTADRRYDESFPHISTPLILPTEYILSPDMDLDTPFAAKTRKKQIF